jgi:hypothetical protein
VPPDIAKQIEKEADLHRLLLEGNKGEPYSLTQYYFMRWTFASLP